MAAENGHSELVKVLLRAGADADQGDRSGVTPLFAAADNGNLQVVQALLEWGANVKRGQGLAKNIAKFASSHLPCEGDKGGFTPLYMAAQNGHSEVAKALLEAGADPDQGNIQGETPLFTAMQHGHLEVAKVLLEAGANCEQCMSGNGLTPLIVAAWAGHAAVIEALLGAGADSGAATTAERLGVSAGSKAAAVVALKGHAEVKEVFDQGREDKRGQGEAAAQVPRHGEGVL